MVRSICMTLVYCPGLTCIQEGWQYHSLIDFQLGVKLDSITLPDICTKSSECHTGFCNSGSDLIINVHCSGESASRVDEFINNFQFLCIAMNLDGQLNLALKLQRSSRLTASKALVRSTNVMSCCEDHVYCPSVFSESTLNFWDMSLLIKMNNQAI